MKTTNYNLFLLIISIILVSSMAFVACEGPVGSQGPQGPEGLQGPIGPAGENGSVMYAGEGTPAEDLGNPGDFYLNTSTGELYGPKNETDGWGVPISLKGPAGEDGQDGEDGSQIYAGNGAPAASLGKVGDFYLNKSTFDLYGPKTASGWGTPINLQGNANVIYSDWLDANWNYIDDPQRKVMRVPINVIDYGDLRNNTLVMVYVGNFGDSSFYPLPGSGRWSEDAILYSFRFGDNQTSERGLLIEVKSLDGTNLREIEYAASRGTQFRYILIPGSNNVSASAKLVREELPVDLNNYRQVKKYFGIRE